MSEVTSRRILDKNDNETHIFEESYNLLVNNRIIEQN
jgi:hypothetical protein